MEHLYKTAYAQHASVCMLWEGFLGNRRVKSVKMSLLKVVGIRTR